MHHINELNTELEGKDKLIYSAVGLVKAVGKKLSVWCSQVYKVEFWAISFVKSNDFN